MPKPNVEPAAHSHLLHFCVAEDVAGDAGGGINSLTCPEFLFEALPTDAEVISPPGAKGGGADRCGASSGAKVGGSV